MLQPVVRMPGLYEKVICPAKFVSLKCLRHVVVTFDFSDRTPLNSVSVF